MKLLETIELRSPEDPAGLPVKEFLADEVIRQADPRPVEIRIYRNVVFEYDISVHLYWDSPEVLPRKSALAVDLHRVLGEYGLVNHKIWKEEKIK